MTDEKKLKGYIDEIRAAIRLDWMNLATKPLIADERKAIRLHLEKCHSALKDLKDLVERSRSASQKYKLENHQRLRRSSTDSVGELKWVMPNAPNLGDRI